MPYAYIHYPFENQELFERNFPGDFVAEGLDQTRGWYGLTFLLSSLGFRNVFHFRHERVFLLHGLSL